MVKKSLVKASFIASAIAILAVSVSADNVCNHFICQGTSIPAGTPVTIIGCNCLTATSGCATPAGSCWVGTLSTNVAMAACLQSTGGSPNCSNGGSVPVSLTGYEYPCDDEQTLPNGQINVGCNCSTSAEGDPVTSAPLVIYTCTLS